MRPLLSRALPCLALLWLIWVAPAIDAHSVDAASARMVTKASSEQLVGELRELIINNRVANTTIRHRWILLSDGTGVTVRGNAVDALAPGSIVEIIGQRNGRVIVSDAARALGAGSGVRRGTHIEVEGELRLLHIDYLPEERSRFEFEVLDDQGGITPLDLNVNPDALRRGMRVIVRGLAHADGSVEPESIDILALPAAPKSERVSSKATITNNALVILIQFADSSSPSFTQAQVQATFAGGAGSGSVAEYFREVSYGQQLLNATVTPWLRSTSATPASCDFRAMGSLARSAASAAGYATGAYQNLVYVFPHVSACGWSGLAYIDGNGVWSNGQNSVLVYTHELGHNFGLLHAASLDCGSLAVSGVCSSSEYGDPFDAMGNQRAMHYNAVQKSLLGWISASGVATHATGTATYTLAPLEIGGGATYAVKIRAATNRTYWLEYRQPIGFDGALAAFPNNGAQVRVASPFETLCGGCDAYSIDSEFLDMTPGTPSFLDGTLVAGQSYTDNDYGYTINVLTASPGGLTVQVSGPGGGPPPPPPPPPPPTGALVNLGFEAPSLAGGFQYSPAGAGWTFVNAGITGNANGFTSANPPAPEGAQVAFLQNNGSSASQSGTIAAGSYSISLRGAQRANYQSGVQIIEIQIDGVVIGSFQPPNAGYMLYQTPAFTLASGGSHTITLRGIGGGGSDFTAFVDDVQLVPGGGGPTFANFGFETPNLAGGYQYAPPGGSWTFVTAGITGNGNGFTGANPSAPEGEQVAFLQGNTSSASQSGTIAAGSYAISLRAAQRGNYQSGVQIIEIQVDGVVVGIFQPPNAGYTLFQTPAFTVASGGSHTIALRGIGGGGSDFTAFVDDVRLVPGSATPTVANSGFEAPGLAGGYQYSPPGAGWTFVNAGVSGNGNAFTSGNPGAPEGAQVGFLQGNGSSISQSISMNAGNYAVSLRTAQRGNWQSGVQVVEVVVDGAAIAQFQPPGVAYVSFQTPTFSIASNGSHTITLRGVGGGGSDVTAFVDDVRVVQIP